jgi:hypothetical protein
MDGGDWRRSATVPPVNKRESSAKLSILVPRIRPNSGTRARQFEVPGKLKVEFKFKGDEAMKVMVIVKANKESEAGILPSTEILAAMGKYNEELVKAGVMLAGEGLHASSKGKRVKFLGGKHAITDGPFAESKELIAGFWLWQVKSMEEAVEWLKRSPFDGGTEIEIRQVFEAADFGENLTPELKENQERLRKQASANK